MFVDELELDVAAGNGGDGLVHFASRKYQAFGGPDGGDGGRGADVVLAGSRNVDSLAHLRNVETTAKPGGPGGPNLKIGAAAANLELAVPPGTLASDAVSGVEIGAVRSSMDRLVVAAGGRGGRGNTQFATSRRQAPKRAELGKPAEALRVALQYRIYADTALIEPAADDPEVLVDPEHLLMPVLLAREAEAVDYDLYRRRPRWVRVEVDFRRYDVSYLPLDLGPAPLVHFGEHVYWPQHAFLNLLPADDPLATWQALQPWLMRVELRRLQRLTVIASHELFPAWALETDEGNAEIISIAATTPDELRARFDSQLTGGVVE